MAKRTPSNPTFSAHIILNCLFTLKKLVAGKTQSSIILTIIVLGIIRGRAFNINHNAWETGLCLSLPVERRQLGPVDTANCSFRKYMRSIYWDQLSRFHLKVVIGSSLLNVSF
jgi:hypothetical protein